MPGKAVAAVEEVRHHSITGAARRPTPPSGCLASGAKRVAKIDDYVEEYLSGQAPDAPPPEFPVTSQVDGELRELRVRFANRRYRILYQRSENLIVLLHAFEKNTGAIPASEKTLAKRRMADFKRRMDTEPRRPPRAAGKDAPSVRR